MTAVILLACHSLSALLDLADAIWENAFALDRSLSHYRVKRRLQRFRFHCRQLWLRQPGAKMIEFGDEADAAFDYTGSSSISTASARHYQEAFLEAERRHLEPREDSSFEDIEVVDGTQFNATFYEAADSLPKYENNQLGQLAEGISFTVTGHLPLNCERFSINLVHDNETRDVALHINPRLPQNYIVRNTKVQNIWGREDVSCALPFCLRRGDDFSIQVLITEACYMISVNGHHFAEYAHRIPYRDVRVLEVKGDVEGAAMQRSLVLNYPQRLPESEPKSIELRLENEGIDEIDASVEESVHIPQDWCLIGPTPRLPEDGASLSPKRNGDQDQGLTLPYYGTLPRNSLVEGRCLKIEGRVRLLPHSFYINLQQGQDIWPHPVIAFHLNPRFTKASSGALGKAVVCRNAWYDGKWGEEERSELDTNFRPGQTFSLAIVCTREAFEVYVNRQFITEFQYKVSPALVDTVYIQGDVKLWNVTVEPNPLIRGKNLRIYHNPVYSDEY